MSDQVLIYDTLKGEKVKKNICDTVQCSILGPELWNIKCENSLEMPDNTHLVEYVYGIAAVIQTRNMQDTKKKKIIPSYVKKEHGVSLATEKTELILLTKWNTNLEIEFEVQIQ